MKCIIFFLFLVLLILPNHYVEAQDWLEGWTYRKQITLYSNWDVQDYPIKIKLMYESGEDNDNTIYLNQHSKTDFGDIRFTDSDKVTLLDYWIEELNQSDYCIVWVEIPNITSGENRIIYIYYGNDEATSISNGFNTFLEFDNFDDGVLDNKWKGDRSSFSENNGYLYSSSSGREISIEHTYSDVAVRSKMKISDSSTRGIGINARIQQHRGDLSLYEIKGYAFRMRYVDSDWQIVKGTSTWVVLSDTDTTIELKWYINELRCYGSEISATFNNDSQSASVTDTDYNSGWCGITVFTNYGSYWDWWLVRPYVDPEPYISSVGLEEEYSPPEQSSEEQISISEAILIAIVISIILTILMYPKD